MPNKDADATHGGRLAAQSLDAEHSVQSLTDAQEGIALCLRPSSERQLSFHKKTNIGH